MTIQSPGPPADAGASEAIQALLVDGDPGVTERAAALAEHGIEAVTANSAEGALGYLDDGAVSEVMINGPGEVFVETAQAVIAASRGAPTIIISGPAADVGYLCPAQAHAEGGMEPHYTAVAAEAEALVRAAAVELVGKAPVGVA